MTSLQNSPVTKEQLKAALQMTMAVADSIRELGEVPAGKIYAVCMGALDANGFDRLIDTLVGAKVVERLPGHVLKWVGPVQAPETVSSKKWTQHTPEPA